jgi:hypothetical protein
LEVVRHRGYEILPAQLSSKKYSDLAASSYSVPSYVPLGPIPERFNLVNEFLDRLLESANLDNLWTLAEPSHYAPGARAFECDMPNAITQPQHELYPTDPQSMIDLSGWQKAQAGSFCAAAHLLFRSSLGSSRSDFDSSSWTFAKQLLYAAPWFQIEVTEQTQHTKLAVVQHTLGNQVAGLLSVLIREHMILKRVEEGWSNGTALPPSPMAIPFLSFMGLPQLFDIDSVSKFSSCHTAAMATPSFFEDGTWTGYEVRLNSRPHTEARDDATTFRTDAFLGFGADNRFVILNHQNEPPNSARNPYNICVKRHATFRLQRWIDDRYFALQTNCFQSARDEHVLQLKVDSWTGLVPIVRFSNFYGEIQGQCSGVITPFGLVVSSVFSGHWMWMWKREWSSKD